MVYYFRVFSKIEQKYLYSEEKQFRFCSNKCVVGNEIFDHDEVEQAIGFADGLPIFNFNSKNE